MLKVHSKKQKNLPESERGKEKIEKRWKIEKKIKTQFEVQDVNYMSSTKRAERKQRGKNHQRNNLRKISRTRE